jgi:hypothetical protein
MSGTITQQTVYPGATGAQTQNAYTQALGGITNTPFTPYGGQLVAGQNGTQNAATNAVANNYNYQPQQVTGQNVYSTNTQAQQVTPGSITGYTQGAGLGGLSLQGSDLSGYMNPYQQQVINTSLDQINRNNTIQNQQSSGQAAQAGAFGGDRAAIQQTENNRNAGQTAASMIAGLNLSGYQNAQTQANADINRQLSAGTTQAQLNLQGATSNQAADLQSQLANQSSGLQAQLANQGTNLKAQQSNQAAGLTNNAQGTAAAGLLYQMGTQAQQTSQAQNAADYAQFMRQQQYPLQQSAALGQTVGTFAPALGNMAAKQTVYPNPSTASQAAGYGTAAVGLAGLANQSGLFGAAGNGLSSLGTGISNAYNSLFGDSANAASDTAGQFFNFPLTGGGTGVETGALEGLGSYNPSSIFSQWKNGGVVDYADGGEVDDNDHTWLPADGRLPVTPLDLRAAELASMSMDGGAPEQVSEAPVAMPEPPIPPANAPGLAGVQMADAGPPQQMPMPQQAAPQQMPMPQQAPVAPQMPQSRVQASADPGNLAREPASDGPGNNWAMPVLTAGLAMLGGTSPNAAVNIGQGGLAGVAQYQRQLTDRARIQSLNQNTANAGLAGVGQKISNSQAINSANFSSDFYGTPKLDKDGNIIPGTEGIQPGAGLPSVGGQGVGNGSVDRQNIGGRNNSNGGNAVAAIPADLLPFYKEASAKTGIPIEVLAAKDQQESGFDNSRVGKAGEIGISQIMPSTARDPGFGMAAIDPEKLKDPRTNILYGAEYLKARGGLAAYNGGGDPNYVKHVTDRMGPQGVQMAANNPGTASDVMPSPMAPGLAGQVLQSRVQPPQGLATPPQMDGMSLARAYVSGQLSNPTPQQAGAMAPILARIPGQGKAAEAMVTLANTGTAVTAKNAAELPTTLAAEARVPGNKAAEQRALMPGLLEQKSLEPINIRGGIHVDPLHPERNVSVPVMEKIKNADGSESPIFVDPMHPPGMMSGVNGQPIITKQAPATESFQTKYGGDLAAYKMKVDDEASSAVGINNQWDNIRAAAPNVTMGAGGSGIQTANTWLLSAADKLGIDASGLRKQVASGEDLNKNSIALVAAATKQASSNAAASEMQYLSKGQPSLDMSKGGFHMIADQMQGVQDYKIGKQAALQSWLQGNEAAGVKPHATPDGFDTWYNQQTSPAAFAIGRMASTADGQARFKELVSGLQTTPEGQSALKGMLTHYKNAQKLGLFGNPQ